jgi:hypothetical protein
MGGWHRDPTTDARPSREQINSGLLVVLAGVFLVFFQAAKHNPELRRVNPFYNDPYDAASSLATVLTVIAAVVALLNVLSHTPAVDHTRLARSQLTPAVTVAAAVYCDLVALVAHPASWLTDPDGIALTAATCLLGAGCGYVCARVLRTDPSRRRPSADRQIGLLALAGVGAVVLLAYPPSLRDGSTAGALGAIVDGDVVLLVLTRYVVLTLVPGESDTDRRYFWPQVVVAGLIIGFGFSLLERFAEGGQTPLATVLFTLAWCFGITAGYAMLALPLGLYRATPSHHGH